MQEYDFIVKKKPEGNQDLKLELIADTKLSVIVSPDVILFLKKKLVKLNLNIPVESMGCT